MKDVVVLKFGGTSMGSAKSISACVEIVKEKQKSSTPVVVVSAVSGITSYLIKMTDSAINSKQEELNQMIETLEEKHFFILCEFLPEDLELAKKIWQEEFSHLIQDIASSLRRISVIGAANDKTKAYILSYGERLSSLLMKNLFSLYKIKAKAINSDELIVTNSSSYLDCHHLQKQTELLCNDILAPLLNDTIPIITGFFGANEYSEITLLGRGGSDYSASIIASAINAKRCEIWTDVDGIMSTDPRVAKNAQSILNIDNQIAAEMAFAGAKILHPRTIQPSQDKGIPVVVLNTFNPSFQGTLISNFTYNSDCVIGIVNIKNNIIIDIKSYEAVSNGFIANIANVLDDLAISIDVITTSETSVSLSIKSSCYSKEVLETIKSKINCEINVCESVSKVSVIGYNIARNISILGKIFEIMSKYSIENRMISISAANKNISIMVDDNLSDEFTRLLHDYLIINTKF